MLRPWRYLTIDFETTWLDTTKDEPVQIGMLVFNERFEIIHKFSSYIKPDTHSGDLKEVVQYLTWITADQLIWAPSMQEICKQIAPWFDDQTVIIGHNVRFDLQILRRYMAVPHRVVVDTYDISRIVFHFLPSYSLSVIYDHARRNPLPALCTNINAHDALSDCIMTRYIFQVCIERLEYLFGRFTLLSWIWSKSQWRLVELFIFPVSWSLGDSSPSALLPALQKNIPPTKKSLSKNLFNLDTLQPSGKYSISGRWLRDFFQSLPLWQNSLIVSFAHKPKTVIAKEIIQDLWHACSTFHDSYVFDNETVDKLLGRSTLEHDEFSFFVKYFSAVDKDNQIIDLNTEGDYKIFSALTSIKPLTSSWCVVCTHDQLWTFAHKIKPADTILFFDHEWRFQTAKKQTSQHVDLLYLLTLCDQLAYKYNLHWHPAMRELEAFSLLGSIFVGILHIEINQLYIGYQSNELEIENIRNHTRLPKIHVMYSKLFAQRELLQPLLLPEDAAKLHILLHRLQQLGEANVTCTKQMRWWDKWFFTLAPSINFVSYDEIMSQLPSARYFFLTHTDNSSYQKLPSTDTPSLTKRPVKLHTLRTPREIIALCTKALAESPTPCIYITCAAKSTAQQLFNACMAQGMQHTRNIQVENITWWHGSTLFQAAKATWPRLLIWGLTFFLQAVSKHIVFKDIVAYHLEWPLKQHILADIMYYADQ